MCCDFRSWSSMDAGSSESSSGGEPSAGPSKTPALPTATRIQRNKAEKQRRDRLNGYISELANLVPMVSNASKPLDKVSILRLAAAQMRLNISCLNPKKFKAQPVTLPSSVMSYLDVIEKTIGGFIMVTTFSGCIVFCSKSIEDFVGYQNIDVMGNSIYSYIHSGDVSYFEKKVNSVISSQKKNSKKNNKVIKVHMQQRPLPRSHDIRYRKMIFKISVHANESGNGKSDGSSPTPSKVKKTSRLKDFGASAVVLFFVEPVRLEPEIDISYIESHQDAYFTMHGLQGEIIYADQRISSITGYMAHDVQGISAYKYICSSDVPIALFAQQAMFTSSDGTGTIVYRLRIRDMRYIYLQSCGQTAYKDSSNELSHFVCFNKLLSDEEGCQELKKFQQRYAPQIMAAKLRQGKQLQKGEPLTEPQVSDLALAQAMEILKETSACKTSEFEAISKSSSSAGLSDIGNKSLLENKVCTDSSLAVASTSVHSSDSHSLRSTIGETQLTSSAPFQTQNNLCGQLKPPPSRSILRSNCSTFSTSTYDSVNHNVNSLVEKDIWNSDENEIDKIQPVNETYPDNIIVVSSSDNVLPQNIVHSVNASISIPDETLLNDTLPNTADDPALNFVFDYTFLQRDSDSLDTTLNSGNGDLLSNAKRQCHGIGNYYEYNPYLQISKENPYVVTQTNDSLISVPIPVVSPNSICDQQLDNRDTASKSIFPRLSDFSSFSALLSDSDWSFMNRISVDSGIGDTIDYSSANTSLYPEASSFSNHYMPCNDTFNNGAVADSTYATMNGKSKTVAVNHDKFNSLNGFETDVLQPNFQNSRVLDSEVELNKTSVNADLSYLSNGNVKQSNSAYQSDETDIVIMNSEPMVNNATDVMEWNNPEINLKTTESLDLDMSKELYNELELFFKRLPQNSSYNDVSEFSIANSNYLPNNISMAKSRFHQ